MEKNDTIKIQSRSERYKKIHNWIFIMFIIFLIITIVMNVFIYLAAYDSCLAKDILCEYGMAYNIVNTEIFSVVMVVESVMAIIVSVGYFIVSIIDKKWFGVLMGIIGVVIVPLIWLNLFPLFGIVIGY